LLNAALQIGSFSDDFSPSFLYSFTAPRLMVKLIYLDSNVFISSINKEIGYSLRGLFVEAEEFFFRISERKDILVLSGHFLNEVNETFGYSKEEVLVFLNTFGLLTKFCDEPKTINFSKYRKAGSHFKDSLHVALAIHFKCDLIVTFNTKDFENAKKFIKVISPAEY